MGWRANLNKASVPSASPTSLLGVDATTRRRCPTPLRHFGDLADVLFTNAPESYLLDSGQDLPDDSDLEEIILPLSR